MRIVAHAPALVLLLYAPAIPADVVILQNGSTLEGIVRREGRHVRVEMEFGAVTVDARQVAKVEARPSPLEVYRERAVALPEDAVTDRLRLAAWCARQGLEHSAREQYECVIANDPNNAEARARLGHRLRDGVWMTEDDYRKSRGEVWSEGRWQSPSDVAEREDARRRDEEAQRLRAEVAATRQREEGLERELARAREEADRRSRDSGPTFIGGLTYYSGGGAHCPGAAVTVTGGVPWWSVPSWQNPNPSCSVRQDPPPEPARTAWQSSGREPWHTSGREPWHASGREPWHIPAGEAWHAMSPGWGGSQ